MKSVKELLELYVTDQYGHVHIPEDILDRKELGKALLGASLINSLDYWLDDANDLIENAEPRELFIRKNEAYKIDKTFRDALSTLSDEQKMIVVRLIQRIATGLLFNILADLDQFDYGQIKMQIKPKQQVDSNEKLDILPSESEIHNELGNWVYHLSRYSKELVEKLEDGYRLKN